VSATRSVKTYGYGQPVLVQYRAASHERTAVLRTMAASLLLSYDTFNDLPRHVRAVDVGVLQPDGATTT
jgi:tRNA C32,U32 (ribose-2'-O)-methylase TrmJ